MQPIDVDFCRRRLGGERQGARIHCPGPGHSRSDRSLEVWIKPDAPEGFLVHSFAGDDPLACRDYVREALSMEWRPRPRGTFQHQRQAHRDPDPLSRERSRGALSIWEEAGGSMTTRVADYLRSRGLTLTADLASVLRFHQVHGMVALFRDIITDEPCGIHRTYLDVAGRKLDRKMLGRAKGAAIKLDPDADVTTGLSIGEGIETTLTGRAAGFRPAWALGSAGAIASFPVLSGLEVITVFAEHDKSGANQRAIEQLAQRYTAAGCEVFILQPTNGDLNTAVDLRGAA